MTRIVHLSDIHFGREDAGALALASDFIAREKPDLVVATGDLTLSGTRREMEAAFAWLRGLNAPVMVTPGNHDVPFNLVRRLFRPFGRFKRHATGVETEIWRGQDAVVVGLNTARGVQPRLNWAQGAVSPRQVHEVAAAIGDVAPKFTVVATHHPLTWPDPSPLTGRTWGGRRAEAALARAGVDVFLSGHLHAPSLRAAEGGAISVSAGTLSRRLRGQPCSFAHLSQQGEALEVALLVIQGERIEIGEAARFSLPAPNSM